MTGVVTGLGTAAVKTAADFDSAMSKVCLLYTSERILSLTDGGENYSRWESSA